MVLFEFQRWRALVRIDDDIQAVRAKMQAEAQKMVGSEV